MNINDRVKLNLVLSTLAFVVSAAGSVLLHIVFATTIYKQTGSGLLTSLFISLQWLPVLAVLVLRSDWEDGVDPRKRWLKLELIAALLTCPILLFIDEPNYYALFALLFLRGMVDHVARTIKTVSARAIFPADKAAQYAPILQSGYHVGIALAAVIGIGTGQHFTMQTAVLADVASFLVAAALLYFVKTINAPAAPAAAAKAPVRGSLKVRLGKYGAMLLADRRLFFCALLAPVSATFFQGTYSVFQPVFPLRALHLDANAVALVYVLTSVAILGGSSSFSYLNKRFDFYKTDFARTKRIIFGLSFVSALAYLGAAMSSAPLVCAVAFTLMIFTFEVVWMFGYGGIVAYSPNGELGSVFGISFGIGCCAASLCVVIAGALLDYLNGDFALVVSIFMAAYLLLLGAGQLVYQRLAPAADALPVAA